MKFTWSWLKEHLETDKKLEEIINILPMLGLEVEEVEDKSKKLKDFIIAKVVDCITHPNADRLKILSVDDNSGVLHQVICGAPNARKGLVGVFAKPGMYIPGTGITLEIGEIRGEKSYGMMCSERELEISDEHDGIIEISSKAKIGDKYVSWAGIQDPIITIGITPNRPDCLGVRGIARDLAAAGMGFLKPLPSEEIKGTFDSPKSFGVSQELLDLGLVPVVSSRYFRNLKNEESPKWMQQRLLAIGQRPISALVDITNYIMIDLNRPLHAYDGKKIVGPKLEIRFSKSNEKITTLNEKTYELSNNDLVISDAEGVDDLAGIMGGERTGVSNETSEMFLEIAIFNPISVAKTGRRINLISDARYRFERGLDETSPDWSHNYITKLILDCCGGEASYINTIGSGQTWKREIEFSPDKVLNLTGVNVSDEKVFEILTNLGFDINSKNKVWKVSPPPWRVDIDGDADLVEEVIRIYGYDTIPQRHLQTENTISKQAISREHKRLLYLKRLLAGRGMMEMISYSFMSSKDALLFNGGSEDLKLVNPISSDLDCMRPSLMPNLLSVTSQNIKRGVDEGSLFEIGPVFLGQNPEDQKNYISGIRYGDTAYRNWTGSMREYDWLDVRADVGSVLTACGFDASKIQLKREASDCFHPGRSAVFSLGKNVIASFGQIHPVILDYYSIKKNAVGFEIYVENIPLSKKLSPAKKLLKLNPLQPVERDFSFIINKTISSSEIVRTVSSVDKSIIKEVRVFDLYEGSALKDDEVSIGLTVIFQAVEKTFSENDLETLSKKIIENISTNYNGVLRSS